MTTRTSRWFAAAALAGLASCSAKEGDMVRMMRQEKPSSSGIPAIDAAAPAKTETATFAVG